MRGVDYRAGLSVVGTVVKYLALTMAVPLFVGVVYGDDIGVFAFSLVLTAVVGLGLERLDDDPEMGPKEALFVVSFSWFAVAVIGAVPYVLAGYGSESSLAAPVNALFESTSGFTTTGATVMRDISVGAHSHAVMMWRQLTQWLGGMGIIVLMVAILPELGVNGAQLMKSEAPGPELQKLTPRILETARALWLVYFGFTALLVVILYALHLAGFAPRMNLYNSVAHAFSTLPTGGFSTYSKSIAAFSAVVQWVIIPFMVVAGVNFALFWQVVRGDFRALLNDVEFRVYAGAVAVLAGVVAFLLYGGAAPALEVGGKTQGATVNALRQGIFQVASLLNSTGFA
ncbi:MAG: potassium transporter TrkG, partial [Halobacteria archaeon]|nr:potassium transporter TrkG [Halobacteria archaeon]